MLSVFRTIWAAPTLFPPKWPLSWQFRLQAANRQSAPKPPEGGTPNRDSALESPFYQKSFPAIT